MTIDSTSSSSSGSTSRISGLASGLDTESLVTSLTSDIQQKIDNAYKQKQLLEWKQDYYQEIATKLNDFYDEYFSSSSSIAEKLQQLSSTSSNSTYVKAIASSSASSGSIYIDDIKSLATSAKLKGTATVSPELSFAVDTTDLSSLSGSSFNITLDGVSETITFADGTYSSSSDVATALQSLVDDAFGSGRITISGDDGNLTFSSTNSKISISNTSTETDTQALGILGFDSSTDPSSNRLSLSTTTLSDLLSIGADESISFSINGETFSFTGSTSLSTVVSNINSSDANVKLSYSDITDNFTFTSKQTGAGSSISVSDTTGSFLTTILGNGYGTLTKGTDAVVTLSLDGSTNESSLITVSRSTNSFTVNGVSLTLNTMASGTTKEQVTISTAVDTEELSSTIKSFVEDYNTLLKSITDKLNEKVYKDYEPLTDSEKEDLSDNEIEKWESYAKSGILRNDSNLQNIYDSLRSCMYSTVYELDGSGDSIGLALSDIGITTGDYTKYGQLTIDEDELITALNENADGVIQLLTQKSSISFSVYNSTENKEKRTEESGILYKLSDILQSNLNATGKKGALITLVGNPDTQFIGTTTYSKKISDVDTLIDELEEKLEDKQEFYYNKFTAMETAINTLNSQAAWLTSSSS